MGRPSASFSTMTTPPGAERQVDGTIGIRVAEPGEVIGNFADWLPAGTCFAGKRKRPVRHRPSQP